MDSTAVLRLLIEAVAEHDHLNYTAALEALWCWDAKDGFMPKPPLEATPKEIKF